MIETRAFWLSLAVIVGLALLRVNPALCDDASAELRLRVRVELRRSAAQPHHAPIDFSPDSKLLAIGSRQRAKIDVWNLETAAIAVSLEYAFADVKDAHIKRLLFAGGSTLHVVFWRPGVSCEIVAFDLDKGAEHGTMPLGGSGPRALAISPDGKQLVAAPMLQSRDQVKVWDSDMRKPPTLLDAATRCTDVAFTRDGKLLATVRGLSDAKGQIIIRDAATLEERRAIRAGGGWLSLTFSGDGKLIAAGFHHHPNGHPDTGVRVWDIATGKEYGWMSGFEGPGRPLANVHPRFAPDRRSLVAVCTNAPSGVGVIKLWDLDSGEQRIIDAGFFACEAAYSPDGRLLATPFSGSVPGVKLWDAEYGTLLKTLDMSNESDMNNRFKGRRSHVERLRFSPNGRWLAAVRDESSTPHEEVFVWRIGESEDKPSRSHAE